MYSIAIVLYVFFMDQVKLDLQYPKHTTPTFSFYNTQCLLVQSRKIFIDRLYFQETFTGHKTQDFKRRGFALIGPIHLTVQQIFSWYGHSMTGFNESFYTYSTG